MHRPFVSSGSVFVVAPFLKYMWLWNIRLCLLGLRVKPGSSWCFLMAKGFISLVVYLIQYIKTHPIYILLVVTTVKAKSCGIIMVSWNNWDQVIMLSPWRPYTVRSNGYRPGKFQPRSDFIYGIIKALLLVYLYWRYFKGTLYLLLIGRCDFLSVTKWIKSLPSNLVHGVNAI